MTTKTIVDTDPGISDVAALTMAINDPSLDLKLATTVAGNVTIDKTTANALKTIHFLGKDTPVAADAKQPLVKPSEDAARIHGGSGVPGHDFGDDYGKPPDKTTAEALHDAIMAEDEVILVPTGSYTNIASFFSEYLEVKNHIKQIVTMGSSFSGGNMTSAAEFSVFAGPDAARIMYNADVLIVTVGLDVTLKALLTADAIEGLGSLNKTGEMLHGLITHYNDGNDQGRPMYDANTIFHLLHPEAFTTKDTWVDIQMDGSAIGATAGDIRAAYHDGKTNAKVCLDIDAEYFDKWSLEEASRMK